MLFVTAKRVDYNLTCWPEISRRNLEIDSNVTYKRKILQTYKIYFSTNLQFCTPNVYVYSTLERLVSHVVVVCLFVGESGESYLYRQNNDVHKSSSLEVYYQCTMEETSANMVLELFCQIISEPCFDILRTTEQLGK